MVTKSIKFDDEVVQNIETVIKKLNDKIGVDLYDFSNMVRLAVNQYLNSDEVKELIKDENDLLLISEVSLSRDWLKQEEDIAWKDL